MANCEQCGRYMNPIETVLGPVCGDCCRKNHMKALGIKPGPRRNKATRARKA